jgi:lactoylglutathione lyase
MGEFVRPRVVGFNHVALEVGVIDEALAFYGRLFRFELRGKSDSMAFIDLGDQFIALQKGRRQPADDGRHFGLVVDDKEAARKALEAVGVTLLDGPFLDFRDSWGNRIEIVGYDNVQFTKAPNVLRGMGLMHLGKNEKAKSELAERAWRSSRLDTSTARHPFCCIGPTLRFRPLPSTPALVLTGETASTPRSYGPLCLLAVI